ncbi:hypothetical protein G6F35_008117 [Rhizopus arrhizus]|nr:hypothetical protein G6F35_008117 [Rhizopus arrhizus]
MLAGLLRPLGGTLYSQGQEVRRDTAAYFARVAFLGHANGLCGELTALENLRYSLHVAGTPQDDDAIATGLRRWRLEGSVHVPAARLSQGQGRRLAMAAVVLGGKPLWLLDEPDAGLDAASLEQLWRALDAHLDAGGAAVMALETARGYAGRHAVLHRGGFPVPAGGRPRSRPAAGDRAGRAVGLRVAGHPVEPAPPVCTRPRQRRAGATVGVAAPAAAAGGREARRALGQRLPAADPGQPRAGAAIRPAAAGDRRTGPIPAAGHAHAGAGGRSGRGADAGPARRGVAAPAGAAAVRAGADLRGGRRVRHARGPGRRTATVAAGRLPVPGDPAMPLERVRRAARGAGLRGPMHKQPAFDSPYSPAPAAPGAGWLRYASPAVFYPLAGRLIPVLALAAALFACAGLYVGLAVAPTDSQQGEVYRILFIHVAAAWMSMFLYLVMAGYAALGLIYNTRLSFMMMRALAPTGALFTFLTLWTGALWGKPTWGAWWVWDARLTSELILLFLYLGFMALQAATDDTRRADRGGAILLLAGVVNVPIIYFSVRWWSTLHQGASINLTSAPSMARIMVAAMLLMVAAFWLYSAAVALARVRGIIAEREPGAVRAGRPAPEAP